MRRKPRSDAEWARSVERRLAALERPKMIRMGNWCVSVSPVSGSLVADHIPTGNRRVIAETDISKFYDSGA